MAFLAEKPLVHVRIFPLLRAVCSTGKLKVRPSGRALSFLASTSSRADDEKGLADSVGEMGEDVRKASTESAR